LSVGSIVAMAAGAVAGIALSDYYDSQYRDGPGLAGYNWSAVGVVPWLFFLYRRVRALRPNLTTYLTVATVPAMVGTLGAGLLAVAAYQAANVALDRSPVASTRCEVLEHGPCGSDEDSGYLVRYRNPRDEQKPYWKCFQHNDDLVQKVKSGARHIVVRTHPGALGTIWAESERAE
jgi:hypothetical protein